MRPLFLHCFTSSKKILPDFSVFFRIFGETIQKQSMKYFIKIQILIIFSELSCPAFSVDFSKYFEDRTLRVDYIRTGNAKKNTVNAVTFSQKSGQWAGSTVNLLDPFNYGSFRVLVKDAATGTDLYSRTYSTLFGEYAATPAGKKKIADFEETVLIPYPQNSIEIHFQERDKERNFYTQKVTVFDPRTAKVTPKNSEYKARKLHYSGDSHCKLDVVIVADGYTENDSEKMAKDFEIFTEGLFKYSPYKEHKGDFNVWGIPAISKDSGITNPQKGKKLNTAVGSSFNVFDIQRYIMTLCIHRLHDVINDAPYEQVIIMSNTKEYGGGAIYNFYADVVTSEQAPFIIAHEFGHTFAGLADEYVDPDISYDEIHDLNTEPLEPNITSLVNFGAKWKDMLDSDTPIPTPVGSKYLNKVGVYEGGGYRKKGMYRPMIRCMMGTGGNFCPVCRKAINDMFGIYTR